MGRWDPFPIFTKNRTIIAKRQVIKRIVAKITIIRLLKRTERICVPGYFLPIYLLALQSNLLFFSLDPGHSFDLTNKLAHRIFLTSLLISDPSYLQAC